VPLSLEIVKFSAGVLHLAAAAAIAGDSGPFWEMLVLLACCDKSTIVALEAIKGLAGGLGSCCIIKCLYALLQSIC
jgi:hypothetical protein